MIASSVRTTGIPAQRAFSSRLTITTIRAREPARAISRARVIVQGCRGASKKALHYPGRCLPLRIASAEDERILIRMLLLQQGLHRQIALAFAVLLVEHPFRQFHAQGIGIFKSL